MRLRGGFPPRHSRFFFVNFKVSSSFHWSEFKDNFLTGKYCWLCCIFWIFGVQCISQMTFPTVKLSNKLRVYIDFNLPSAAFIIFSILIETQWFCRDFAWSPCCWFPPTDMLVRWTRYFNLPVGVNVTVNVFVCLYCVCALWQIGSLWGCTPLHAQCMLGQAPSFPLIRIHLENGELTIKRVGHLCIYT